MRPAALFTTTVGSSLRPSRASWAAGWPGLPAALRWWRFSVSASACAEVMLDVLLALLSVLPVSHVLSASHAITTRRPVFHVQAVPVILAQGRAGSEKSSGGWAQRVEDLH